MEHKWDLMHQPPCCKTVNKKFYVTDLRSKGIVTADEVCESYQNLCGLFRSVQK